MDNIFKKILGLIAAVVMTNIGATDPVQAQVQDVIWEKTYCLDDKGTVIDFYNDDNNLPPSGQNRSGSVLIVGDTNMLRKLDYEVAQYLFVRACIEAANINLGYGKSGRLECDTAKFLSRRFNTGPSEIYRIVEELGNHRRLRKIARELSAC
ncbi:MAG: hypothetical protein AAGA53_04630 [Pseudomonadota bacterium]